MPIIELFANNSFYDLLSSQLLEPATWVLRYIVLCLMKVIMESNYKLSRYTCMQLNQRQIDKLEIQSLDLFCDIIFYP
jgi:hypothetical protein